MEEEIKESLDLDLNNLFSLRGNGYIDMPDKFTNTEEFQTEATFFKKHGVYTLSPKGTYQYIEYWKNQRERCLNGFTNSDGLWIPGTYYFYLNFVQIKLNIGNKKGKGFPKFLDLDFLYFQLIDYCKKNQKSLTAVKGRRQGWSYKAAALGSHEFNFSRDSSTIVGAYLSNYSQNTMNMILDNCNFLNRHTAFGRQRNPDTSDNIQAKYQAVKDGKKFWKGLMSTVQSITYKDRPGAGVGRSADYLILDEVGIFPNIIESYGLSEPLIKDGSVYTGVCIMFGSSDSMDTGSIHFKKIFTSPKDYNMLGFKDPKNSERIIGFFSAAYFGRWGKCRDKNSIYYDQELVDKDGNSNVLAAIADILYERDIKKKSPDPKVYRDFVTQFPIYWEEAFLISAKSPFPTYLAEERLAQLETTRSITDSILTGKMVYKDRVEFQVDFDAEPILQYPVSSDISKLDGAVQIYEPPYQDSPSYGIYIAGIDPYDDDQADSSTSLGSIQILNTLTNRIVAEYTGRPQTAKEFYEVCRRMLIHYNAMALYENNKKGLFTYFEQKNSTYLLCDTPKILKDMQITKISYDAGNNAKGVNATKEVNKYARECIKTWMLDAAFSSTEEDYITNTHTIMSIPLLKEIIYWNMDGNFDRVSSLGMLLILKEDRYKYLNDSTEETIQDQTKFLDDIYSKKTNKSYVIDNQKNWVDKYYPKN
jgi:hypothetical protein